MRFFQPHCSTSGSVSHELHGDFPIVIITWFASIQWLLRTPDLSLLTHSCSPHRCSFSSPSLYVYVSSYHFLLQNLILPQSNSSLFTHKQEQSFLARVLLQWAKDLLFSCIVWKLVREMLNLTEFLGCFSQSCTHIYLMISNIMIVTLYCMLLFTLANGAVDYLLMWCLIVGLVCELQTVMMSMFYTI